MGRATPGYFYPGVNMAQNVIAKVIFVSAKAGCGPFRPRFQP
jgi:hypothetical protein